MTLSTEIKVVSDLDSIKKQDKTNDKEFIELAEKVYKAMKKEARDARDAEEAGNLVIYST